MTCVSPPVALDTSLTGPRRQRKTPTTAGAAYSAVVWAGWQLPCRDGPPHWLVWAVGAVRGGWRVSWRLPPSSAPPPAPATPTQSRPTHAGSQATQSPTGPPHCHAADTIGVTAGLGAGTARSRRAGSEMRCAKRAPQSGSRQQRVGRTPHPSRLMSRRPPLGPSSRRRPPPLPVGHPARPSPSRPPLPSHRLGCVTNARATRRLASRGAFQRAYSRRRGGRFGPNSTAPGRGCWRRQRDTASSLARGGGADPPSEHSWQGGSRGDGCRRWPARPPAPGSKQVADAGGPRWQRLTDARPVHGAAGGERCVHDVTAAGEEGYSGADERRTGGGGLQRKGGRRGKRSRRRLAGEAKSRLEIRQTTAMTAIPRRTAPRFGANNGQAIVCFPDFSR